MFVKIVDVIQKEHLINVNHIVEVVQIKEDSEVFYVETKKNFISINKATKMKLESKLEDYTI